MTWNEFKENVEKWAEERGIYEYSTPEAQLLKALSELGELADAVVKNDREALKDAIGDVAVCMVNYAKMAGHGLPDWWATSTPSPPVAKLLGVNSFIADIAQGIGFILDGNGREVSTRALASHTAGAAAASDLNFADCCHHAWLQIKDRKDRKGHMVPGGAFVKDGDE